MKYKIKKKKRRYYLNWAIRTKIDNAIETGVTKDFRELLFKHYPELRNRKNGIYRRLTAYLMFSGFLDEESGNPVTDWPTLGYIEGKVKRVYTGHYRGEDFLKRFQALMPKDTVRWSQYSYSKHQARVVEIQWHEEIIQALRREHMNYHKEIDRVNIVSGTKIDKKKRKRENKRKRSEPVGAVSLNHPVIRVIHYIHTRNEELYTKKVNQNVVAAREMINNLPDAKKIGGKIRDQQHNILTKIVQCPMPIYTTSKNGNTDRIFDISGYMNLKREVREQLLSGWKDYDLKSCQLAICAYTWNVPEVIKFIEEGKCIWSSMLEYLGHDPNMKINNKNLYDKMKEPLKRLLYQTIFGMTEYQLRKFLAKEAEILWENRRNGIKPTALLDHPLIAALLKAKKKQMKKIKKRGKATTCFGKEIKVSNIGDIRSALAQQAQALELNLLLPVIDLAKESDNELQILLWCHDGFVAHVKRKDRMELWDRRLKDTVKNRAEELGIKTELESEQL
ncbi:MAG: hypothetical protein WBM27_02510 [bacterium]